MQVFVGELGCSTLAIHLECFALSPPRSHQVVSHHHARSGEPR